MFKREQGQSSLSKCPKLLPEERKRTEKVEKFEILKMEEREFFWCKGKGLFEDDELWGEAINAPLIFSVFYLYNIFLVVL